MRQEREKSEVRIIHTSQTVDENIGSAVLQVDFPGNKMNTQTVIFDANHGVLPFRNDSNLQFINPERGVRLAEMKRVGEVVFERDESILSKLPVIRQGKETFEVLTSRGKKQDTIMRQLARDCIENGIVKQENIPGFMKKLSKGKGRWVIIDTLAAGATEGIIYAINLSSTAGTIASGNGEFWSWLISQMVAQGTIRSVYFLPRVAMEAAEMVKSGKTSYKDIAGFIGGNAFIGAVNFIPGAGLAAMPFISFHRNRDLLENYGKLLVSRNKKKFRHLLRKDTSSFRNGYDRSGEPFLEIAARKARKIWAKSDYPLLTSSEVGIDPESYVASQAHYDIPFVFREMFGEGQSEMVDAANYLPNNDFAKMKGVVETGRTLARSPYLAKARRTAEPILRRILPMEKYFNSTVSYFVDELLGNEKPQKIRPLTTFHYAVGNTAIEELDRRGRSDIPVIHYITDPHVHPNFFKHSDKSNVFYFTYDAGTRDELVEKGVPLERTFVIGYPTSHMLGVDLRDSRTFDEYEPHSDRKLQVAVFTGGLGGNQEEITTIAQNMDYSRQKAVFYCGVNHDLADKLKSTLAKKGVDFAEMTAKSAKKKNRGFSDLTEKKEAVIICGQTLEDLLPLSYQALRWGQVIATKPSGDIGIEAALMAGKPTVVLEPLGDHEAKIRKMIRGIGGEIEINDLHFIGDRLRTDYTQRYLLEQARRQRSNLLASPPIPLNWQGNAQRAYQEIERLKINPYKG